jgi:hypothetical protein
VHPHHPVAHALVLGLAVPENDLSRREGIAWEDSVGLTLARRIDPQVVYLREGYESALFRYYFRLWAEHPWEMLGIYVEKLRVAGRSMISKLLASAIGPLAWPLAWVPNGGLLALYAAFFGSRLGPRAPRIPAGLYPHAASPPTCCFSWSPRSLSRLRHDPPRRSSSLLVLAASPGSRRRASAPRARLALKRRSGRRLADASGKMWAWRTPSAGC